MLNALPLDHRRNCDERAQTPRIDRRQTRAARGEHQQDQQRIDAVVARHRDKRRKHRQRKRAHKPSDRTEPRRDDPIDQRHREHRTDPLRDQQAQRREAEQLRAQPLQPQPQRRLVDRDQPIRIRTEEEEGMPRAQHRLHGSRVEDVGVAVLAQPDELEQPAEHQDRRETHILRRHHARAARRSSRGPRPRGRRRLGSSRCRRCLTL